MKLTSNDRKALAILGQRRPICDMGKDRYRSVMYDLCREGTFARFVEGSWELTSLGRENIGKVRGGVWCRWAESMKAGGAKRMAAALNSGGTEAGHALLNELRTV